MSTNASPPSAAAAPVDTPDISAGVVQLHKSPGWYYPAILDSRGRVMYTWGYPRRLAEAKTRAKAELDLLIWVKTRKCPV